MSLHWPTLNELTLIWALIALPVLVVGLKGWDPVGRWGGEGLGGRIDSRWAWFVMEVPGFVTLPAIYLLSGNFHLVGNIVLVLWLAHYVHRTFVWPWLVPKRDGTVSLAMCGAAVSFNLINGGLLGWFIAYAADYPAQWLTDPRFVVGIVVMLAGAGLNVWADYRLLHLRNRSREQRVPAAGRRLRTRLLSQPDGRNHRVAGFRAVDLVAARVDLLHLVGGQPGAPGRLAPKLVSGKLQRLSRRQAGAVARGAVTGALLVSPTYS